MRWLEGQGSRRGCRGGWAWWMGECYRVRLERCFGSGWRRMALAWWIWVILEVRMDGVSVDQ